MNSKKALELLKSKNKCIDAKTYRKMLEAIENDLEMLDIIKKHKVNIQKFERTGSAKEYNDYFTLEDFEELNKSEFNRIKEWLENE